MNTRQTKLEKLEAQEKFCRENHYPRFALNRCVVCGRSWAECGPDAQYTVQEAGSVHITACPFCHRSWCN